MNVTVSSDSDNEIKIKWVGLKFDWMTTWIQKDLSSNPLALTRSDTVELGTFDFQIPLGIAVGNHNLTLTIGYDEYVDSVFTVPSPGCMVVGEPIESIEVYVGWGSPLPLHKLHAAEIHSINEKLYKELKPIVFQQLGEAVEKTYLSGGAKDLLQKADSNYIEAALLAEQNKWSEAYQKLQLAQSLLNRMPDEESKFISVLSTGSIAGIIVVIGVVLFLKKRDAFEHSLPPLFTRDQNKKMFYEALTEL